MGEKIVVGPINKGLRSDRTAFVIDNDSFPVLINAYQWRGRIKRKRGTSLLGRLQRNLGTTDITGAFTTTISPTPITAGIVSFQVGTDIFTDQGGASPVTMITNSSGSATLNRTTGVLTITGSKPSTSVIYFPTLPVMGLEDLALLTTQFPGTIAFDTTYAYNISPLSPYTITDVSFYKNPAASPSLSNYTPKSVSTPLTWSGKDYQQFWSVNYQGALWVTNGVDSNPFTGSTISMQYRAIENISAFIPGPPGILRITITNHGLVDGDFLFVNEINGIAGANFQTGFIPPGGVIDPNTINVKFQNASFAGVYLGGGIAQYLTNTAIPNKDCIRWYDGDPTTVNSPLGWVNFCPPLSQGQYSIADLPAKQYYLVGAKMIVPFKDRLLFLGAVVQSSSGSPIYLQDTIVYSQNGTPYYTCSFTGSPTNATTQFFPILLPANQTATPTAFWEDQTGFGGFLSAGISQPMTTASPNEDVIIIGFTNLQTRLIYTGNDIIPFNLFVINSELGSSSTFSAINMDHGVLSRGNRGFVITGQTNVQRIDLDIPDQVFESRLSNNGVERITAQRDFINEWVYFSYPSNEFGIDFPTQTLLFNYRDNSWGIFNETYTTYGSFRRQSGLTWLTLPYQSWNTWNDSWLSGDSTLFQPQVIAGNQQGFVLFREDSSTNEGSSLYIQNIVGSVVTSPNHCLNEDDFIVITGVVGSLGTQVNNLVFQVSAPMDTNTFTLDPNIVGGAYQGGGLIQRLYRPIIRTKQFPVAWELARKTRIGPQQYLLSKTTNSQMQLLIYLSQDYTLAYNDTTEVNNDSLIYSTVLYTCPESTNLGLTPANTNLQMPTAQTQQQIWHRINTSLIGDTVQLGFTISDDQMRAVDQNGKIVNAIEEIELHGFILDVNPSQLLS